MKPLRWGDFVSAAAIICIASVLVTLMFVALTKPAAGSPACPGNAPVVAEVEANIDRIATSRKLEYKLHLQTFDDGRQILWLIDSDLDAFMWAFNADGCFAGIASVVSGEFVAREFFDSTPAKLFPTTLNL